MGKWLALLTVAVTLSASAAMAERVEVRFAPSDQPACYLQFDKDTMRIAATQDGLATAKPIKAVGKPGVFDADGGVKGTSYRFHDVSLPTKPPGIAEATATFGITRFRAPGGKPRRSWVGVAVHLRKRDERGMQWSYIINSGTDDLEGTTPASPKEMLTVSVFSDLSQLTPAVETQVKGHQVAIGIRMWAAPRDEAARLRAAREAAAKSARPTTIRLGSIPLINDLRREGKPAPARVEVHDASGKPVSGKDGDLQTFGFG